MNSAIPTVEVMGIGCVGSLQYFHPQLSLRNLGTLRSRNPWFEVCFYVVFIFLFFVPEPSKLSQALLPLCCFRPWKRPVAWSKGVNQRLRISVSLTITIIWEWCGLVERVEHGGSMTQRKGEIEHAELPLGVRNEGISSTTRSCWTWTHSSCNSATFSIWPWAGVSSSVVLSSFCPLRMLKPCDPSTNMRWRPAPCRSLSKHWEHNGKEQSCSLLQRAEWTKRWKLTNHHTGQDSSGSPSGRLLETSSR